MNEIYPQFPSRELEMLNARHEIERLRLELRQALAKLRTIKHPVPFKPVVPLTVGDMRNSPTTDNLHYADALHYFQPRRKINNNPNILGGL